jgi:phosphatidylglycerophosphate synthase
MDPGRKLPENLECPVDNFYLKYIVDPLNPFFKSIGMTPNGLTTISGIFGFLSVYYVYKSKYKLAALFFLISYIFDVFDGNFARKYNMVTVFGDWFDHVKDVSVVISLAFVIFMKKDIKKSFKIKIFIIASLLFITTNFYMVLQEDYYHNNIDVSEDLKSKSLGTLKSSFGKILSQDKNKNEELLNKFKYVGCGTLNLYIPIALFLISFNLKK